MAANPEEQEGIEWEEKSNEKLDQARQCKDNVKKALHDLEQKHADKLAAIAEERRRQERLAAEALAREKRAQERRQREAYKALQAAELQAKKNAVKAGKKAESQALKQATADFKAAIKSEHHAKTKAKRIGEIKRSESFLQNAYLTCHKQYRMWYVAVKTCEMRLEEREKRPAPELIEDNVQRALERELVTLNEARSSIKELVDECAKLNGEMTETMTMLVTGPSRDNVMGRRKKVETIRLQKSSSMPSLPAIGKAPLSDQNDFANSMNKMFTTDCPGLEELLKSAFDQAKRAYELTGECAQVLENCRNNCNKVMAISNASLDQRKSEIDGVRKCLEQEREEAAGSIRDATQRISMLKMRASHHPQTQEELEEIQAFEVMLTELKAAKILLEEDWRTKTSAFKIDEFCRNLTPIRAATLFKSSESPNATPTAARLGSTDFPMSFNDGAGGKAPQSENEDGFE